MPEIAKMTDPKNISDATGKDSISAAAMTPISRDAAVPVAVSKAVDIGGDADGNTGREV